MNASAIALRPDLDLTLAGLYESLGSGTNLSVTVDLDKVRVHADAETPVIALGTEREVPITAHGLETLASALQVPAPYFKRMGDWGGPQAQALLLNTTLDYSPGGVIRAEYAEAKGQSEGGLLDILDPNVDRVRPVQVVEVAEKVLKDIDSPVQRLVHDNGMFSFDVHVPLSSSEGIYGDPSSKIEVPEDLKGYSWITKSVVTKDSRVGDITAAGMRFVLDMKHGRAPSAQPWAMRLACTNGMEMTTDLTKVDGRGLSVDEVLWDLEMKSSEAFARLEREVAAFYEMRNTPVANPERRLRAIANERGIPDRSLMRMLDVAPEVLGDNSTEFDLVNVITNLANRMTNDGGRMLLERAGGHLVTEHSVRCHTCNHVLAEG